ncbi:hypothetical protein HPB48_004412 [Haemaphysalis longicornis]|uniref:Uncharacterized protein n=1 Tax=Haemaphysalis longicornis TaxID=44386 RepID=A0A9J6G284_HAELO|nr:hypothetical protein HPB48_004412 [Haemaphysalis longicornis]
MNPTTAYVPWTPGINAPRLPLPRTVILKLTDNTNLAEADPSAIGQAVQQAAHLTKQECRDIFIKLRRRQNLLAVDAYRDSAAAKLLALQQIALLGNSHPTITYEANNPNNAQGVIHGVSLDLSEDFLQSELLVPSRKILRFRRLGQTASLLITIEGPSLPRHAVLCSTVFRLYPPRPNSQQCLHCFSLEHRTLVCPNRNVFLRCATCGTKFPPDQSPSDTRHDCEPRCVNCSGEHPATDPNCPARDEATKVLRERTRTLRRRYMKTQEQPPLISSANDWPALPTSNRFELLASSRSRSKGREKSPHGLKNRNRSRSKRREKSPHGFKNRNRSRSQRRGQRVGLKINHSLLPQTLGYPLRLDSRKHEVISNVPCVNSPAPPPTRQVSGPANPSSPTSTPSVNPLAANTSPPQTMHPTTASLPSPTPQVNPLSAPTSSSQVVQPIFTHIDIQNIVRATLDQILPSLLEQLVPSIVSQALSPILAALQELTARLASLEDDRLPHKRTTTATEDCDSMQNE